MSKSASRLRRVKDDLPKPSTREKFLKATDELETSQNQNIPKFVPANARQKEAVAMLKEGRSVVFLTGSAGSGKSVIAAHHAATLLKAKKVDKVYLVRPAVAVGKSIGLLPGTVEEKLAPFFAQTVAHLGKFLGQGPLSYYLEKKVIELKPVEYLRGTSFERCVVIAEECQNFTSEEFEMLLTRLGDGGSYVMTGDQKQHDLRGDSGLSKTLALIEKMQDTQPKYLSDDDLDEMEKHIGIVEFTPDDVVRSGLTRAFVKMYFNN